MSIQELIQNEEQDFKDLVLAYCEAIIFTECHDDSEGMDGKDTEDFSDDLNEKILTDCKDFYKNKDLINSCPGEVSGGWSFWEQVGHDFWLTRNRHGAGAWDRDYCVYGSKQDAIDQMMKAYHETYVYLGDDGMIYSD